MIHRFGAVVAGAFTIVVALRVRRGAARPWLRALSLVPVGLVLVQIGVGVASVLSLLNLTIITAHLGVGAALLGSFVVLWGLCPTEARSRQRPLTRSTSTDAPRDAVATP